MKKCLLATLHQRLHVYYVVSSSITELLSPLRSFHLNHFYKPQEVITIQQFHRKEAKIREKYEKKKETLS